MKRRSICRLWFSVMVVWVFFVTGCDSPDKGREPGKKVGMVLNAGGDKDRGYNEYSLAGARSAARKAGIGFEVIVSKAAADYGANIDRLVASGADLVMTIGYALAQATATAARKYPERSFVIMDYAYSPGKGCSDTVSDCYTREGGLSNVTSIVFAEDQPAYLAGVLSACMSETGIIGVVAGEKIPPVVRLAVGFENGARSLVPDIRVLRTYIPDFRDPAAGYASAAGFISKGADVLFCPAGETGLGGLRAATDHKVKAIGVDVDQYLTVPEAGSVLMTSVVKNVDIAAGIIVRRFARGSLKPGVIAFDLKSLAVGLAPFHEWEDRIPQACKDKVALANKQIVFYPAASLQPRH